jgi:hypothetical protein
MGHFNMKPVNLGEIRGAIRDLPADSKTREQREITSVIKSLKDDLQAAAHRGVTWKSLAMALTEKTGYKISPGQLRAKVKSLGGGAKIENVKNSHSDQHLRIERSKETLLADQPLPKHEPAGGKEKAKKSNSKDFIIAAITPGGALYQLEHSGKARGSRGGGYAVYEVSANGSLMERKGLISPALQAARKRPSSVLKHGAGTGGMKSMGESEKDARDEILSTAKTLFKGQVAELRVLFTSKRADSGYFDDMGLLADAAVAYDRQPDVKGIYVTLNPVKPEILHRAKNKVLQWAPQGVAAADKDILERRLILIDIDGGNRPSGISATAAELAKAKKKACAVARFLAEKGFADPFAGMSGNGYHLLYPVSLPNDDESRDLIRRGLEALSFVFDDGDTKIDTSVFNAARITKLYGTVARKGDNTPERPHRRAVFFGTKDFSKECQSRRTSSES